jgi:hypothetical protein
MQAITTKYIGPTNSRVSRIKASCPAGSVTLPYDCDERDGGHYVAAVALMRKLGWENHGTWYRGETTTGSVYVCSPRHASAALNIVPEA